MLHPVLRLAAIPTLPHPAPAVSLGMRPLHSGPAGITLLELLRLLMRAGHLQRPVFRLRAHRQSPPRLRSRAVRAAGAAPALVPREVDRHHWLAPLLFLMPGDTPLSHRADRLLTLPVEGKVARRKAVPCLC